MTIHSDGSCDCQHFRNCHHRRARKSWRKLMNRLAKDLVTTLKGMR